METGESISSILKNFYYEGVEDYDVDFEDDDDDDEYNDEDDDDNDEDYNDNDFEDFGIEQYVFKYCFIRSCSCVSYQPRFGLRIILATVLTRDLN